MEYLLDQLLNGLSLGCIYAFIALGYTMVYGIIKLINFAHGEFFMVGAFAGYFVLSAAGIEAVGLPEPLPMVLAFGVAMLAAALAAGVLAVVIERVAYRPLMGSSRIAALLTALGVSLFLQNVGIQVFSAEQRGYPEARRFVALEDARDYVGETFPGLAYATITVTSPTGEEREVRDILAGPDKPLTAEAVAELAARKNADGEPVSGFYIASPFSHTAKTLIVIISLALSFGLLWLLVQRTQFGRAMRAVSYNPEAAKLMGIRSTRVISMTFFVGAFLAGIGGIIWGMRYGKIEPFMGFMPGLKAFIAAVIGGIGSIPGAVLGGILLGVLEVLIPAYLPSEYSGYKDAVAFIALIAILLYRPQGLLGRFEGEKV